MAHYEPPHQDLRCLQIQLFSSLVVKELKGIHELFQPGRVAQSVGHLTRKSGVLGSIPGPEVIKLFSCSTQLSMKF